MQNLSLYIVQLYIVQLYTLYNFHNDSDVEKTEDPSLLFRGNSIATKAVDLYMKLIGSKYLKNTLGLFIRDVYDNAQEFEVHFLFF